MSFALTKITIEGYRSIRKLDAFPLRDINVLIGANGSGKSNFVSFFRLLRALVKRRLQLHLQTVEGGADAVLHHGRKVTGRVAAKLEFGQNDYEFELYPTPDNQLVIAKEVTRFHGNQGTTAKSFGSGHAEAKFVMLKDEPGGMGSPVGIEHYVHTAMSRWVVYHVHDTSLSAGVRRQQAMNLDEELFEDFTNLAPFLYGLSSTHPRHYERIRDVVRLVAPFFDDFKLRVVDGPERLISLEWTQVGSDFKFWPHHLSDGTLRFICLATALLQPRPPDTILFDEPELGLHPYAIHILAALIRQCAAERRSQVIITTQSPALVSELEPENIIVVERSMGESLFSRVDGSQLSEWLDDYTLGDLWQKNLLGGQPRTESLPRAGIGTKES